MYEADVTVTTLEHSKSVRLPVGVPVDMSCVAAGVSMLWASPNENKSEGVMAVIEQVHTETSGG